MTISITEEIREQIDSYHEKSHVPKSSIIMLALEQYFQTREIMTTMKDLTPLMQEIKNMTKALESKNNSK